MNEGNTFYKPYSTSRSVNLIKEEHLDSFRYLTVVDSLEEINIYYGFHDLPNSTVINLRSMKEACRFQQNKKYFVWKNIFQFEGWSEFFIYKNKESGFFECVNSIEELSDCIVINLKRFICFDYKEKKWKKINTWKKQH